MKIATAAAVASLAATLTAEAALAFCGFYVAKADAKLFNRASQVVLVRHEVLQKEQIHVGDRALIDHLDAYTSPRLVEYFDENPCARPPMPSPATAPRSRMELSSMAQDRAARSVGVTIEARYTVGEYDILILSARESGGLETWLRDNGYRLPAGAGPVLASYIKQSLKFFVARVNLAEQSKLGYSYLRPLQMAFESPKFMLPIRLGTLNADGPQELFAYALTRKGRVETTNYRTVRLPSDVELPVHVKGEFPQFYRAMFGQQVTREDMRAVFLEYAWDMSWCDPCAADPLSSDELRKLGVFWLADSGREPIPVPPGRFPRPGGAVDVFVTRLHVRYDAAHFPDDLVFQETGDRANFQGRYILRHPWKGDDRCEAATRYREALRARGEREAAALSALTGWPIDDVRRKMLPDYGAVAPDTRPWWKKIWND
jgi:hypothetical protein